MGITLDRERMWACTCLAGTVHQDCDTSAAISASAPLTTEKSLDLPQKAVIYFSHWLSTKYCWGIFSGCWRRTGLPVFCLFAQCEEKRLEDLSPLLFLWFNKARWRSLKGCCIHTFYTQGVISSELTHLRVLVNGVNSGPGRLTQLGLGQGLGRDWVRGLSLVGIFTCPSWPLSDNGLLSAFMQHLAACGIRCWR